MSNVTKELFFPDVIYHKDLENHTEINTDLIDKILQWRHDDPEGVKISNSLGWQSRSIMQEDKVRWKDILKPINEFLQEVLISEQYVENSALEISNMCANINYKYAYNRYHEHSNCLWAGVYYVQSPSNCGNIMFHKEWARYQSTNKPVFRHSTPVHSYQWDSVFFKPIEGRIILFPSWMGHQVEQNLTDIEGQDGYRISISFNVLQVIE